MTSVVVLNPTLEPQPLKVELAPRLADLNGRSVGVLDNGKHNSERFLQALVEEMDKEYHFSQVIWERKPTVTRPANEEQLGRLVGCDFVLTGVGN